MWTWTHGARTGDAMMSFEAGGRVSGVLSEFWGGEQRPDGFTIDSSGLFAMADGATTGQARVGRGVVTITLKSGATITLRAGS